MHRNLLLSSIKSLFRLKHIHFFVGSMSHQKILGSRCSNAFLRPSDAHIHTLCKTVVDCRLYYLYPTKMCCIHMCHHPSPHAHTCVFISPKQHVVYARCSILIHYTLIQNRAHIYKCTCTRVTCIYTTQHPLSLSHTLSLCALLLLAFSIVPMLHGLFRCGCALYYTRIECYEV